MRRVSSKQGQEKGRDSTFRGRGSVQLLIVPSVVPRKSCKSRLPRVGAHFRAFRANTYCEIDTLRGHSRPLMPERIQLTFVSDEPRGANRVSCICSSEDAPPARYMMPSHGELLFSLGPTTAPPLPPPP